MGIYTKLSTDDYKELEKKFILHCEADPKTTDYDLYVDNAGLLTFGIGFSIEGNSNWLIIAILQKISGLKPLEEIERIGYKSDVLSYSNGKYDNFIECCCKVSNSKLLNIIRRHKTDYKVLNNQKIPHLDKLSKEIQQLIEEYNKQGGIEKIPVKSFSFTFTEEEIDIIYNIGKQEYTNKLNIYLTEHNKPFNHMSIKETKLYISLLSFVYRYGSKKIQDNQSNFMHANRSRFLLWFTLRYKIFSGSEQYKRRIHEAAIFCLLECQKDDINQADIPASIKDIFSHLNFPVEQDGLSYLDQLKTDKNYRKIDEEAKKADAVRFSEQKRYDIIRQSVQKIDSIEDYFVNKSFFKNNFLDNVIDFASSDVIFSIFTQFIKESFTEELKNKKGSEELFLLENIYVVECINKEKFLEVMSLKYSSLQAKCNVLLFLNSTSDIVNDISILQSKCPQVHFSIALQSGYTYSFKVDKKSSSQTNIMLYSVKDGKYHPELLKDTFKAEKNSNEESRYEKNILLFSAEENNKLSGRLSNNANIFHITCETEEKIISKVKLYNLISDKYTGNIQVDMQGKEYEVSSDKSSGEFTVDVRLSILDEALKEEDINDKPYYMYVNKTGEIFESKISNGRASFYYNPEETNSNQKVLFSFNKADFASKKAANSKSLDFMLINKTDRKNKKAERTFNINKGDVPQDIISGIELYNIEEIAASKVNRLSLEHKFKAYSNVEDTNKIKWGYMLLNNRELKSLSNITVLKPSIKLYEKFHQLSETGEIISIIPNKILSKDEVKQIENNNYVFVPIPYFNINYIDIRNFNNNINDIKISDNKIEQIDLPLNFYIVVDEFGKNGFLVRYTYKTVEDAISYHSNGELIGFKADLKVFPEKYGLYAVSPESGNSIVSHVRGTTKNSQYVSASTLSNGAERFNINGSSKKLYIDINKLKQSGATLISTEEISEAFIDANKKLMNKNKVDIHAVIRNNDARHKAIVDQEVLVKGADKKSIDAVMRPYQYKTGMVAKNMLYPVAIIITIQELATATKQSIETNSVNPLTKELTKQVSGWGCAWIGAKIGASIGSGIPFAGTVIGGIVGSFIGGLWGYYGTELFID